MVIRDLDSINKLESQLLIAITEFGALHGKYKPHLIDCAKIELKKSLNLLRIVVGKQE